MWFISAPTGWVHDLYMKYIEISSFEYVWEITAVKAGIALSLTGQRVWTKKSDFSLNVLVSWVVRTQCCRCWLCVCIASLHLYFSSRWPLESERRPIFIDRTRIFPLRPLRCTKHIMRNIQEWNNTQFTLVCIQCEIIIVN